jgi:hypothetical protein
LASCYRHDTQIDVRAVALVGADLRFASGSSLLERGEVHEREFYGALDFVNIGTGEEHRRSMRIDPLDGLGDPMGRRCAEKGEDFALIGHDMDEHLPLDSRYEPRRDPEQSQMRP